MSFEANGDMSMPFRPENERDEEDLFEELSSTHIPSKGVDGVSSDSEVKERMLLDGLELSAEETGWFNMTVFKSQA